MYPHLFTDGSPYKICAADPNDLAEKAALPYLLPLTMEQLRRIFYISGVALPYTALITTAILEEIAKSPTLTINFSPQIHNLIAGNCQLPRQTPETQHQITETINALIYLQILTPNPLFPQTYCYPAGIDHANAALAKRAKIVLKANNDTPENQTKQTEQTQNTNQIANHKTKKKDKEKGKEKEEDISYTEEENKTTTYSQIAQKNETIQTLLNIAENHPTARNQKNFFLPNENQKYPIVHLAQLLRLFTAYQTKIRQCNPNDTTNETPESILAHLSNKYRSITLTDPDWWRDWENIFQHNTITRPEFKKIFGEQPNPWHYLANYLNMPAGAKMYNNLLRQYAQHIEQEIPKDFEIVNYQYDKGKKQHTLTTQCSTPINEDQKNKIRPLIQTLFGNNTIHAHLAPNSQNQEKKTTITRTPATVE